MTERAIAIHNIPQPLSSERLQLAVFFAACCHQVSHPVPSERLWSYQSGTLYRTILEGDRPHWRHLSHSLRRSCLLAAASAKAASYLLMPLLPAKNGPLGLWLLMERGEYRIKAGDQPEILTVL